MKGIFKKTLVFGIISTVLTLSMSVTASAQCPITSLFGGNNSIQSLFGNNSNSCSSNSNSMLNNIFGNRNNTNCTTGNCASGNSNNILNIFKNYNSGKNSTCTTGNCNGNTTCTTGNCDNNTTCTTGNCDTNTDCINGDCGLSTGATCTDGNCDTNSNVYDDYAKEVLKYVNEARKANGLSALALDSKLNDAASVRAKEIATKFSHTRPDGTSCFTVLKEKSITYRTSGENIAYGYKTAKAVVEGWLASPGHRANIMSNNFKYMGIGKNGTNWAQLFIG